MTHDELVAHAARWLRKRKRLPVVLQDVHCTCTSEQPDAIGWTTSGFSTLVECKTSASDLLRDFDKPFRRAPERGMGFERFYAFPSGFVDAHPKWWPVDRVREVPWFKGWGVIEFDSRGRLIFVHRSSQFHERNDRDERALLVQAVRKATEGWGRKTFGDIAPPMVDGDPHPSASKVIRMLREENLRFRTRLRILERLGAKE